MDRTCEFDVAVVGGGPGGSAAAKKCAEYGLKTVMLEKRQLPRSKVCTGMIMGETAQTLIVRTFGHPPEAVLTNPPYLYGLTFRARNTTVLTLERLMPFAWRSKFDFWLNKAAVKAGAELWDRTRVKDINEDGGFYWLRLDRNGRSRILKTKFVIGADGTLSIVRKLLFPKVRMKYQLNIRMCYRGRLNLNPRYVHYFYFQDLSGFEVNIKDDVFLLEITPRPEQKDGSEIVEKAGMWLAEEFGFAPGGLPLWRDGCYEPAMNRPPFAEPFPLAQSNAVLVGNAAGLNIPITGEGIGTAVQSGLLAAEALYLAENGKKPAADYYPELCSGMVSRISRMYPPPGMIRSSTDKGMDCFLSLIKKIYAHSMTAP